jgi:hypothetical protein
MTIARTRTPIFTNMTDEQSQLRANFQPPPGLADVGLPNGTIIQTFHNRPSRKTVVEIRLHGSPPLHRLFWREADQQSYMPIATLGPARSMEDATNCDAPWCFVRDNAWESYGRGLGGKTLGLLRIDLRSSPVVEAVDTHDILPSAARISKLLRVNDAGTTLETVVLLKERVRGGERTRARYVLCALDLVARRLIELDTLAGIRF